MIWQFYDAQTGDLIQTVAGNYELAKREGYRLAYASGFPIDVWSQDESRLIRCAPLVLREEAPKCSPSA